jgi:1-acyl-sn-glycerol-3-phosphate acyltransferase
MIKVVQFIFAAVYVLLHFIISMIFGLLPASLLSLLGFQKTADRILLANGVMLSKGIIYSLGGKVEVIGAENIPVTEERICFVSNHQSLADIPLIVSYVPILVGFITKIELKKVPILSSWIQALNSVYIDRSSARAQLKAILDGVEKIKQGHPLVIFPEGTRSKSEKFGSFKPGSMKLATKSRSVVVPMTIDGTYRLLEQADRKIIHRITLTIHEPIYTADLDAEELKQIPERVFSVIRGDRDSLPS